RKTGKGRVRGVSSSRDGCACGFVGSDSVGFFFQAEDGIRDKLVTGVQTCALPILAADTGRLRVLGWRRVPVNVNALGRKALETRSEERRVGKECICRGAACCSLKNIYE